jgi:hypothetical protein
MPEIPRNEDGLVMTAVVEEMRKAMKPREKPDTSALMEKLRQIRA